MLYKRSSFITWLREVKECEIIPLNESKSPVVKVKNGVQQAFIQLNKNNRIDYEEIYMVCQKLLILGVPGNSELERIE